MIIASFVSAMASSDRNISCRSKFSVQNCALFFRISDGKAKMPDRAKLYFHGPFSKTAASKAAINR